MLGQVRNRTLHQKNSISPEQVYNDVYLLDKQGYHDYFMFNTFCLVQLQESNVARFV